MSQKSVLRTRVPLWLSPLTRKLSLKVRTRFPIPIVYHTGIHRWRLSTWSPTPPPTTPLLLFSPLFCESSQVKCLIPMSQRAAKAVRAKTLRVLVVFCGAAPPVFRLPDGLIYVSFHSHSQFDFFFDFFFLIFCGHPFEENLCFKKSNRRFIPPFTPPRFISAGAVV